MNFLTQMIEHAQSGLQVAYAGRTFAEAKKVLKELETLAPDGLTTVRRAHGQEAAEFASGGRIRFVAATKYSFRGMVLDVLVLDGVSAEIREAARPAAKLAYYA